MNDEERESEEIDIEPFEGPPEFKSSGVLNDDGDQDSEDESVTTDLDQGKVLGGTVGPSEGVTDA